jgi:hypothetical protein
MSSTSFVPFSKRRARRAARDAADNNWSASSANIAADGETIHVPMLQMDVALYDSLRQRFPPRTEFDDEDASIALRTLDAIRERRRQRRSGTGDRLSDNDVRRLTEEAMQRDGYALDALDIHKPGFRYLADRSAGEQARNEMIAELTDAWRPKRRKLQQRDPMGREEGTIEEEDGIDVARAGAAAPKVLPYGAWLPGSQIEGSSCSIDGAAGTWQRRGDYLYCVPSPMPSTRLNTSSGDAAITAQPGTREYVDQVWRIVLLRGQAQQNSEF